jgi:hypothetical protein
MAEAVLVHVVPAERPIDLVGDILGVPGLLAVDELLAGVNGQLDFLPQLRPLLRVAEAAIERDDAAVAVVVDLEIAGMLASSTEPDPPNGSQ